MTIEETIDLLSIAASFDQRTVGKADAIAWHAAIGDLPFADARAAMLGHYRETRDRVMPADIFKRVKAIRTDRLAREVAPAPSHEIADQPGRYAGVLRDALRRIGDGLSIRRAIGPAPVREGPPPEEFTQARAALAEPLTRQQVAALQAAESRALREAADRKEGDGDS